MLRNTPLIWSLSLACLAGSTASVLVAAPDGSASNFTPFVEMVGYQEFSGSMIARPWPIETLAGRGLSLAQATHQYDLAINAIESEFDVTRYVWQTDHYVFDLQAGQTENDVAERLLATGMYKFVEPNWAVYPAECPDDPRLGSQWHHNTNIMDSCAGWEYDTGTSDISVGVCDTGVRTTHEDLQLHRLEGYNAVDEKWESDGGQINDIYGHGTETTGCAAANGNNGIGVSGVGWNLSHRMLRVTNSAGGGSSVAILNHAAMVAIENGSRVASLSYSGVMNEATLDTATYIKSIGGLMIWAAGNSGQNMGMNDRDEDDVIAVGATDSNDRKASWSNYGRFVDFVAPGVDVYTTAYSSDNGYRAISGTSFSCPLTSGLACLIWSRSPGLTPDEVEAILKAGCDDLGSAGVDDTFGYGRINVLNSIALATKAFNFEYPNGRPELLSPRGGTTVRVTLVPQDGEPQAGSGRLHYDDGSGWVHVPMDVVSQYEYDAVFPAFDCMANVDYFFSALDSGGERHTDPGGAPESTFHALAVQGIDTVFADDFENHTGWQVRYEDLSSGIWQREVPSGYGGPGEDFDGSGRCWVTDNGTYRDVDGGPTRIISPTFSLTDATAWVSYASYLLSRNGTADTLDVEVSNDNGNTWTAVASLESTGGWEEGGFWVHDYLRPTAETMVRFSVADNPDDSTTEAALDAFSVTAYFCDRLVLDVPALNAGQDATLMVSEATADATVYFVYSLAGRGSTRVGALGVTLDLAAPQLAGSDVADGAGMAELVISVPGAARGRTVWFQAAEAGRKSSAVEATVN